MATKFNVEDLEITIGKLHEFNVNPEVDPDMESLLSCGIAHIVTTIEGRKIFWVARDVCTEYWVIEYLKSFKVNPDLVLGLLD